MRKRTHPAGLPVLFFAEMWERFSFYGMRSLLTLYMSQALRYPDRLAYGVYGAYGALVYALPALGGLLADRLLGFRLAILMGACLMAAGHFVMAIPNQLALYSALALLCLGNGLFKPNISSLLGQLYGAGDSRRDAGFTIFYMGINVGAFFAPLMCGTLGQRVNWHYGFGLAGVGMLVGLVVFARGRSLLGDHGEPPDRQRLQCRRWMGMSAFQLIVAGASLAVPIVALALWRNQYVGYMLYCAGVLVYGGLLREAVRNDKVVRGRLLVAMVLMAASTVFWALFEQAGSSLTLFAERNVDRQLIPNLGPLRSWLGSDIPASAFQAVNPLFIIALGLPFTRMWTRLQRIDRDPSTPSKFALGLAQLGLGFVLLVLGARTTGQSGLTHVGWLLLMYLAHTAGELCLSPVGLSAMTKLAPPRSTGSVMGAWFLASAYSHHFGGLIAKLTAVDTAPGTHVSHPQSLQAYTHVFSRLGWLAIGLAGLLAVVSPLLKRAMHGVR